LYVTAVLDHLWCRDPEAGDRIIGTLVYLVEMQPNEVDPNLPRVERLRMQKASRN